MMPLDIPMGSESTMTMDPRALLVLTLSLRFGRYPLSQAHADTIPGRASVIDGDTLEIAGTRIRLFGVDARRVRRPEPTAAVSNSHGVAISRRVGRLMIKSASQVIPSRFESLPPNLCAPCKMLPRLGAQS
jgi:hypothetical protein